MNNDFCVSESDLQKELLNDGVDYNFSLEGLARHMYESGFSIEEIRAKLRGTCLNEDFPTCSAVEDAINSIK